MDTFVIAFLIMAAIQELAMAGSLIEISARTLKTWRVWESQLNTSLPRLTVEQVVTIFHIQET